MTQPAAATGWATVRERGSFLGVRLMVCLLAHLPRPLVMPLVHLGTLWFCVAAGRARAASRDYLGRVAAVRPQAGVRPSLWCVYRHFLSFSLSLVERLDAWAGRLDLTQLRFDDRALLDRRRSQGRGLLLVGSHLGNVELCRVLATQAGVKLNILVHTRHAPRFARAMQMAGAPELELLQVTELDAATALLLKDRIDRGEWVVISGDRVPVHGGRTVDTRLLGARARLPIGPWVLAGLLACPVYLLFCLREAGGHRIYCERFATRVQWRRGTRDAVLADLAQRFAFRLEHHLLQAPLQWFNFYPFWT